MYVVSEYQLSCNEMIDTPMLLVVVPTYIMAIYLVGSGVTISKSVPKNFFSHFYEV